MYRIQCKLGKKWKWGLHDYTTRELAEMRLVELWAVGIDARIVESKKLFK